MTDYPSRLQYLYKQFINDLASPEELSEFWQAMDELKEDDPIKEIVFQQYAKKIHRMFVNLCPTGTML